MFRLLPLIALLMLAGGVVAQVKPKVDDDEKQSQIKPDKPKTYDELTPQEKADVNATVATAGGMSLLCIGVVVLLSLFVTFIPGMIATARGHESQLAIWLVCFLLGWTGIGWIIALIWSFAATGGNTTTIVYERERPRRRRRDDDDDR